MPGPPSVRVYITSTNTREATELCVRSARELAGHPFAMTVGDSGSTDGSVEMLSELERRGWLSLERAPRGRRHWEWLDGWVSACRERFAVFVDGDVEFLRRPWLAELVEATVAADAVLTAAEWVPEGPYLGLWFARRFAPWLMLVDVPRALAGPLRTVSFRYGEELSGDVAGGKLARDVAGRLTRTALDGDIPWLVMPPGFRRMYHHVRALTSPDELADPATTYAAIHRRLLRIRRRQVD